MFLDVVPQSKTSALDPRFGLRPPEDDGVQVERHIERHSGAASLNPESRAESSGNGTEELETFNQNIIGKIEVVDHFTAE